MKVAAKLTILACALLAVAVIGYAIYYISTTEERRRDKQISRAKEAVAAKLIDGESARFRNVRHVGLIGVCGEVNGKNRFGAYTGFTGFYVWGIPGDKDVGVDIEAEGLHTMVKKECGG